MKMMYESIVGLQLYWFKWHFMHRHCIRKKCLIKVYLTGSHCVLSNISLCFKYAAYLQVKRPSLMLFFITALDKLKFLLKG